MRFKALVLAGVIALAANTAHAAAGDMWFGLQGGMTIPNSDLSDLVKTGFYGGLSGSYGVAKDFAIGIDANFDMLKGKDEINTALESVFGPGSELKLSAIQATAFGLYRFPMSDAKQMPYVKVGVGLYNLKSKVDGGTTTDEETKSKFGFNGGLGYRYEVSPMYTVGISGAYHYVSGGSDFKNKDGSDYNPSWITVGLDLGWGMAKK